ncbi:MAG: glucose-6-phosphate dehydrogenase [Patescibacteria group bacterium]
MDTLQPADPRALNPTIFVIFGITGDLAARKLIPALLNLYAKKMLPQRFSIIGFSRRPMARDEFREYIRERLHIRPGQYREEDIKHFFDHMSYEQGLFDDPRAYARLADKLNEIDARWGQCSNKLFHLSVPPTLYEGILERLAQSQLTVPCADDTGWTRILIEKPFGNDTKTAERLDDTLGNLFKEEQIFRIDHYLAKESLQNILAFRFSNPMFESLWDRTNIEKIHIRLFEKNGMEGRGAFYDPVGALRDVGQNHMLMMLALVCMDKPASLKPASIRRERARVLAKLKQILPRQMDKAIVRGQYEGYTSEKGVASDSKTETYFRIMAHVDTPRWKGVPMYLESGKSMSDTKTTIDIYFKNTAKGASAEDQQNILTFRIQPDEGIKIRFFVKTPGYGFETEPKPLKFSYHDMPNVGTITDYERLIHDVFRGDQTLFSSTQEIMASWKFITPIIENLGKLPIRVYPRGAREVE